LGETIVDFFQLGFEGGLGREQAGYAVDGFRGKINGIGNGRAGLCARPSEPRYDSRNGSTGETTATNKIGLCPFTLVELIHKPLYKFC